MSDDSDQDRFRGVLRWMRENIWVASAAYATSDGRATLLPSLAVDQRGHLTRTANDIPSDVLSWLFNSGTALVCCCYMEALGKVVLEGKKGNRLESFGRAYMPDLSAECDRRGESYNFATLYRVYRCGFAHQFASADMSWTRLGSGHDFWFTGSDGKPGLNIDRLAVGVVQGIDRFEGCFAGRVQAGQLTYETFFSWLDK